MNNEITIPFNKKPQIRKLIIAIAGNLLGVLIILKPFLFIRSDDPSVIKIVGIFIIIFSVLYTVIIGRQLLKQKPAIILDNEGMVCHTAVNSSQKIFWKDVSKVWMQQVSDEKFIMLMIKNPEKYLSGEKNELKKRFMELNYKLYHTPVAITANALKIGINELHDLICEKYNLPLK